MPSHNSPVPTTLPKARPVTPQPAPVVAGVTFRARTLPLNLAIATSPKRAVAVQFMADGYYTTEDEVIIQALRTNYKRFCTEIRMVPSNTLVETEVK